MDRFRTFVVADRNVERFARRLYPDSPMLLIEASERTKTLETVSRTARWLLSEGADRESLLVAVGGGCTTDLCGFVASVYMRGMRYASHPTTLLAMVDAAIGGKTGVNLDGFKNMLGSFKQPYFIKPVYDALETLPDREYRSGVAEMLKTFLIGDARSYEEAVNLFSKVPRPPLDKLKALIGDAAGVKLGIVEKDTYEKDIRRTLNLGHTVGHAIEWWQAQDDTRPQFSHGEAVSIGIIEVARKSEELGLACGGLAESLKADFASCGLPTELPCPLEDLEPAIRADKKSEGGRVRWVLIRKPGKVEIRAL